MPENNFLTFTKLNTLLGKLSKEKDKWDKLYIAIEIANELMQIVGISLDELEFGEDALNKAFPNSKFKNQKMETWFEKHKFYRGGRIALYLYDKNTYPIESYFYWLNEASSKAKIVATSQLFSNWEDSELNHKPNYNVGIDFFLNQKADALSMVVSNKGNVRLLEFSEYLSHTQIEILNLIKDCVKFDGIDPKTGDIIPYEPQRTIHKKLWDALELSEVNKKFYIGISDHFVSLCQFLNTEIEFQIKVKCHEQDIKMFSSRLIGRLLFVWFLKKKGIINSELDYFNIGDLSSAEYYDKKLKNLFFNTLNTPIQNRVFKDKLTPFLNGGLFDAATNDWIDEKIPFPMGWFESLYAHLNKFNFTTDESSPDFELIAIDPEMLGRVFENLLASIVPETSTAANERKNKGAFYTPREIVSYMCNESLRHYFKQYLNNSKDNAGIDLLIDLNDAEFLMRKSTGLADLWGNRSEQVRDKLICAINNLKILDPACGSGAFPIGIMQLIIKIIDRLNAFYDSSINKFRLIKANEKNDIYKTKLFLIQNTLYGSDLEPMAIEISKLRAWLSLIVDDDKTVEPLPNLEFNFVCANSLVRLAESEQINMFDNDTFEEDFDKLKKEFFETHTYAQKQKLKQKFANLYNEKIPTDESSTKSKQLRSWNPFVLLKPSDFFDSKTMFNVDKFDIVIGNPPYIHFEDIKELSKNIYSKLSYYKSYKPRGDIYTLFYEMGLFNLKTNGILCFITSNKWMRTDYGKSLRVALHNKQVDLLIDLGSGVFESATVDTNIIIIRNGSRTGPTHAVTLNRDISKTNMSDYIKQKSIEIKFKMDDPWVILNSIEQSIKNKLEKYGTKLGDLPNIKINYGIKTGLNEVFIIGEKIRMKILDCCKTKKERELTDKLIRPILRGRDIKKNSVSWDHLYLICTHNGYTNELNEHVSRVNIENYPTLKKYFDKYIDLLEKREDKGETPYNLRSCAYMDDLNNQKILYSEIVRSPQFYLDDGKFLPEASAFYMKSNISEYLVKYLNSDFSGWIFKKYYAGGGLGDNGYRYKKCFFENIPIPNNKNECNFMKAFNLSDEEIRYLNITYNL